MILYLHFFLVKMRRSHHRSATEYGSHFVKQDACNGVLSISSYAASANGRLPPDLHRRDTRIQCTQRKKSWKNAVKSNSEMAVNYRKIARKEAIIRRKDGCQTWDSLNSSPKVVPHTNLTNVNTVGENLINTPRSVTTKSDVSKEKRLIRTTRNEHEHL